MNSLAVKRRLPPFFPPPFLAPDVALLVAELAVVALAVVALAAALAVAPDPALLLEPVLPALPPPSTTSKYLQSSTVPR